MGEFVLACSSIQMSHQTEQPTLYECPQPTKLPRPIDPGLQGSELKRSRAVEWSTGSDKVQVIDVYNILM